jgi:hypothetical protein
VTISTLSVVPEAHASGTASCAEPATFALLPSPDHTRLRPGSRADRLRRPLARHVLRAMAERAGVCVRPVLLRRTDRYTGATEVVEIPCGARLAAKCKPCAERANWSAKTLKDLRADNAAWVRAVLAAHPDDGTTAPPPVGDVEDRDRAADRYVYELARPNDRTCARTSTASSPRSPPATRGKPPAARHDSAKTFRQLPAPVAARAAPRCGRDGFDLRRVCRQGGRRGYAVRHSGPRAVPRSDVHRLTVASKLLKLSRDGGI